MAINESVNYNRADNVLSFDEVQPSSAARDYDQLPAISAIATWLRRLPNALTTRLEQLTNDRSTPALLLYFGALSLPFTILAVVISIRKPLWNDELFTLSLASLPNISDTIAALRTGAEQLPLFYYMIMRIIVHGVGSDPLAIRLPSLIGFLVGGASLLFFLRGRIPFGYALVAALLPLTHPLAAYAYEARPYGLVFGLSGVALCCWQRTNRPESRLPALIALFPALFAVVGCHYYAVLIILPLLAGELLRTVRSRAVDLPVYGILIAAPVLSLALSFPLALSAAGNIGTFWTGAPGMRDVFSLLWQAFVPIATVAVGVIAVTSAMVMRGSTKLGLHRGFSTLKRLDVSLSSPEWTTIVGFALLPVLGFSLALVSGAYVPRYMLSVLLGTSILAVVPLAWMFPDRVTWGLLAALCVTPVTLINGWSKLTWSRGEATLLKSGLKRLESVDEALPIVIGNPNAFLELSYYAPPHIKSRIVYLSDPEEALKILGHNSVERGLANMIGPLLHQNVVPFCEFVIKHDEFVIFTLDPFISDPRSGWVWLPRTLQEQGYALKVFWRGDAVELNLLHASRPVGPTVPC